VHYDPTNSSARPETESVFAFHCSGATPNQWSRLETHLPEGFSLFAPAHHGGDGGPDWHGERAFAMADEAARAVQEIEARPGPIHLVGHSYGGGAALHVACARPDRIASLTLYEPSAFSLLRRMGAAGVQAYAEIDALARRIATELAAGDREAALRTFVDYRNGGGAWDSTLALIHN